MVIITSQSLGRDKTQEMTGYVQRNIIFELLRVSTLRKEGGRADLHWCRLPAVG